MYAEIVGYWLAAIAVVTGCRIHFDELGGDSGSTGDSFPRLPLACNTPVHLHDEVASQPRLVAIAIPSGLGVLWIGNDSHLRGATIDLPAPDQIQLREVSSPIPVDGGWELVASGTTGGAAVRVVGKSNPSTLSHVAIYDAAQQFVTSVQVPYRITSPRSVAQTTSDGFAIGGRDVSAGHVVAVSASGAVGSSVTLGALDDEIAVTSLGSELAVLSSSSAMNCEIRSVDNMVTQAAAPVAFGASGRCTQPVAAHVAGRSDFLVLHHDTAMNDVTHQLATMSGTSFMVQAGANLSAPGNTPRSVAVADGYWVTFVANGQIGRAFIDLTDIADPPLMLGPIGNLANHDVVVHGSDAYAVWYNIGITVARLCR